MALALLFTVFAMLFIGAVAGVAYFGIAAGAAAGAGAVALGSFALVALLFPFLFVLLVFGLIRAGFCPARAAAFRHGGRGPRMSEDWRRAGQEPGAPGKGAS